MKSIRAFIAIMSLGIVASSCLKDDVAEENSNELITTVELKFTERGTTNVLSFEFEDLDGPGGQLPEIDQISLAPNKTYDVRMEIYDESKTPAVEIHEEIEEEGASHRFYFETGNAANIQINGFDVDNNGVPVGLRPVWTTGAAGTGSVVITLRHYEDRGKETSDPVNSFKSSTDAQVTFPFRVQ